MIDTAGTSEQQHLAITQHPVVLVAMPIGYPLTVVAFGVVVRGYLNRDIWARIASTTTVRNLPAADNLVGPGAGANELGDSFADRRDDGRFRPDTGLDGVRGMTKEN